MNKQLKLSLIGETREIKDMSFCDVALCKSPYDDIRLCIRGLTHEFMAEKLDVKQGTFTNIVNRDKNEEEALKKGKEYRPRNFPLYRVNDIQRIAGNRAISQYFDLESKGQLYHQQLKETQLTIEQKAALFDRMRA